MDIVSIRMGIILAITDVFILLEENITIGKIIDGIITEYIIEVEEHHNVDK